MSYIQRVRNALGTYNGRELAKCLSLRDPHVRQPNLLFEIQSSGLDYREVFIAHAKCVQEMIIGKYQQVLVELELLFNMENRNFLFLQSFKIVTTELAKMSVFVDSQKQISIDLEEDEENKSRQNDVAGKINGYFGKTFNDRTNSPEESKKQLSLHIVNSVLYLYFKLNSVSQCKPMIESISPDLDSRSSFTFPKSEQVIFAFYRAKYELYNSKIQSAKKQLDFAFSKCHRSSPKNKRIILSNLIPINLRLGITPSNYLLEKYNLATKMGNIPLFESAFQKNQLFYIKTGTFVFIQEEIKYLAYRSLFKKVYLILGDSRISMTQFKVAFELQKIDFNLDEIECFLANLIHKRYIKGYLHKMKMMAVLSDKDPFPKISSVNYI